MRNRVGAIIIKEKRILLTRDQDLDFFSLPGGATDGREDHSSALKRELIEELVVEFDSITFYSSYNSFNSRINLPQIDHNYLVSIKKEPIASGEIAEFKWVTKEEILSKKVKVFSFFLQQIFPQLTKDELL